MRDPLYKRLALTKYLAIALMFLMPFFGVSCMGMKAMELSGTELALGTTKTVPDPMSKKPKTQVIEADWRASVALGAAVVGAVAALLLRTRGLRVAMIVLGGAGAASLLMLKRTLEAEAAAKGQGLVAITTEFGFWACVGLFALGALAALLVPPGLGKGAETPTTGRVGEAS